MGSQTKRHGGDDTEKTPLDSDHDDVISFPSDGYKSFSTDKAVKQVDSMCHKNEQCQCLNPIQAKEGIGPDWESAYNENKALARDLGKEGQGFDVVFLGDSITEQWNGRWLGKKDIQYSKIHDVWRKYFDRSASYGAMNGLALGIAGDHIANLLWRIQNGELETVESKVFWILIGTNDLTVHCSEDMILLGIIHVVEELRKLKPHANIVINGLLPRTSSDDGKLTSNDGGATIDSDTAPDIEKDSGVDSIPDSEVYPSAGSISVENHLANDVDDGDDGYFAEYK